jgi:hypothetical protein
MKSLILKLVIMWLVLALLFAPTDAVMIIAVVAGIDYLL